MGFTSDYSEDWEREQAAKRADAEAPSDHLPDVRLSTTDAGTIRIGGGGIRLRGDSTPPKRIPLWGTLGDDGFLVVYVQDGDTSIPVTHFFDKQLAEAQQCIAEIKACIRGIHDAMQTIQRLSDEDLQRLYDQLTAIGIVQPAKNDPTD